jgi:hypothetical protein
VEAWPVAIYPRHQTQAVMCGLAGDNPAKAGTNHPA